MGPQKESIMVLKVDLACPRCYKKVKKLLCQFPQIKDQIYNEKQNAVMIKVLCCSPEKIRDKLCCKGGKSIKSIEILEPKKPDPPPKPVEKPAPAPPPADPKPPPPPEKPKAAPPPPPPEPAPAPAPPPADPKPPEPAPKPVPVQKSDPVQCYPVYPVNVCCSECYEGRRTGPCYHGLGHGHGVPPPPPPPAPSGGWCCYDDGLAPPPGGYYDGGCPPPPGYGYKYKPGYCVSRCGDYINDENPTACVIM